MQYRVGKISLALLYLSEFDESYAEHACDVLEKMEKRLTEWKEPVGYANAVLLFDELSKDERAEIIKFIDKFIQIRKVSFEHYLSEESGLIVEDTWLENVVILYAVQITVLMMYLYRLTSESTIEQFSIIKTGELTNANVATFAKNHYEAEGYMTIIDRPFGSKDYSLFFEKENEKTINVFFTNAESKVMVTVCSV